MTVAARSKPRNGVAMRLETLLAWSAGTHRHAAIFLVLACLLAFVPGLFRLPPVDRDEARFAQATKQMVESGDFVDIRFQDESRYKKPVGIYWLQSAVVETAAALGVPNADTRISLYRIPSLIGATGGVLLVYWTALAFVSRRAAVLAGLMMASSILLGVEARLAKTDAMLFLTVIAAMGALARAYLAGRSPRDGPGAAAGYAAVGAAIGAIRHPSGRASGTPSGRPSGRPVVDATMDASVAEGPATVVCRPWLTPAIFWGALAGGILLKGPLILMVVGLTILALVIADRSGGWLSRLKPLPGVAFMLLLVLPWFVAIVVKAGDSFFADSLGRDLLAKVGSGQESHWGPPGLYFLLFWGTFFPAAMLAPMAAGAVWRTRREPGTRFLLAWLVPTWLVFEAAMTKLPHYVLPVYPAVAILIAMAIERDALSRNVWLRRGAMWWFILTCVIALGLIVVNIWIGQRLGLVTWGFSAAAVISALFAWWLFEADGVEVSFMRASAAAILIATAAYGATFSTIGALFPSLQLARAVAFGNCDRPAVATAGYHEPSLVFLVGTQVQHVFGAGAADFLAVGGRCRYVFVEKSQERAFAQRAWTIGLRYVPGPRIEGVNLSSGRRVSIATFAGVDP